MIKREYFISVMYKQATAEETKTIYGSLIYEFRSWFPDHDTAHYEALLEIKSLLSPTPEMRLQVIAFNKL